MFKRRPQWWQLTLLVVLMLAALFGLRYLRLSSTLHGILQIAGIIVGYLLLLGWLRINGDRIEAEDQWHREGPPAYEINSITVDGEQKARREDRADRRQKTI